MKLSVSLMFFHTREHYLPYLESCLGKVPVAMDDGTKGIWKNCREAWTLHNPEAEWHVVLQDDSIIGKDFYKNAEAVLDRIGEDDYIVAFYAGNRLGRQIELALQKKQDHVLHGNIVNENALCMRTKHIQAMIDYCDMRNATTDRYIQGFARRKGLMIYSPIPSLINHRSDPSVYREKYDKPLVDSVRHAYKFIDD